MYACPNGCYRTRYPVYRCPYCDRRLCIEAGNMLGGRRGRQQLSVSHEINPMSGEEEIRYETGGLDIRKDRM